MIGESACSYLLELIINIFIIIDDFQSLISEESFGHHPY